MKFIKSEESDKILKTHVGEVKNSQDAIAKFLTFFQEYKTKKELEHEEADMMLFQYGAYKTYRPGEPEKVFGLNLTRQFVIPGEDEYLQLSLTLFYDPEQIGEITSYNTWSTDCQDLAEWEGLIKETEGYQKSQHLTLQKFVVDLSRL